jgi:hypothetical protein
MSSNDTYHNYKKYSLDNLENWIYDALDCDETTPREIYERIRSVAVENYQHHRKCFYKMSEFIDLLDGNGKFDIDEVLSEREYYEGKSPLSCDKDDPSPECKKSWNDFWEETYYPEESKQYTEEELNAMCDKASSDEEKEKCREYNLREAEYYNKRAKLDFNYQKMKEEVSRNDPNRLKYEDGWVYESPDGGKTVTKRKPGSFEKTIVKADGYSTSESRKKWVLPVQQSYIDGLDDCFVYFPDDLLEAANLKEGDTIEWIDRGDDSYLLKKVTEKTKTYDEMIADGWEMTADGFWIKES